MHSFRTVTGAVLALAALSAHGAVAEPAALAAQQFRMDLANRVQELGKHGTAAVVGLDQWLFLVSELRFLSCETFWGAAAAKVSRAPKADAADPLPAIVDFQRQLKARGIDLLLVPVPPKAAIYPEKLPSAPPVEESVAAAPLHQFYEELKSQGVDVLDLAEVFAAQRAGPDALFCKTDSHWSGAGCVLAAKAIADRIRDKVKPAAPRSFDTMQVDHELAGDLVPLLPPGTPKPARETVHLRQVTSAGQTVQPDPASPILLLGDSHTLVFHEFGGERAGLVDQLALELGVAPDLIGARGSGATTVRVSLYRKSIKDPEYLAKKKVVVWCFTSTEFTESDQGWSKVPIAK